MDVDTGAVLALRPLPGSPARVVAGGRDGILTVWNVATAERVERPLHGHDGPIHAIRLVHRDGASPLLASAGNDGTARLRNIESWTPHGEPLTGHHSWVWSLASVPAAPAKDSGWPPPARTGPSTSGTRSDIARSGSR